MKEQNKLLVWVKEHKKEPIITGGKYYSDNSNQSCLQKQKVSETIVDVIESMKRIVVDFSNINQISFEVSKHILNFPEGWKTSIVKAENRIHLLKNQTWVADYTKGGVVA